MSTGLLYSLAYAKQGDAVFFSHLDTLRIFERAVRRSRLHVCFTQGCNPHIRLSFRTALPVGLATDSHWFSLKLRQDMDPEDLLKIVNEQLPPGFSLVQALRGNPPQSEDFPYKLHLYYSGSPEKARTVANRVLDQEKLEIQVKRKNQIQTVDVRPFLKDCELNNDYILFHLKKLGDHKPRMGDITRALYSFISTESFEILEMKVIYQSCPEKKVRTHYDKKNAF